MFWFGATLKLAMHGCTMFVIISHSEVLCKNAVLKSYAKSAKNTYDGVLLAKRAATVGAFL